MALKRLAIVLASLSVTGAGLPMALAQQPAEKKPPQSRPQTPVPPRGNDEKHEAKPAEPSDAQTSGTMPPPAKLFGKMPQTAEEKSRQLSDLYALLAAAESEEQAKKISDRIERLWALSGSDTVNMLLDRATKSMVEKKTDMAEKLLGMAIGLAPDYAEAFNRRAFFYFTQGNYQAAVGDLRRVLALDPSHYRALEGLAQIWKETGNRRGAFEVMKQLMDIHPFAPGAKAVYEDLKREVEGQGI